MTKNKIDVKKIKERNVSEKEIKENEKETKKKEWLLFRIPVIICIILAVIYILTNYNILLIPIALIFVLVLYGFDCHQRICKHCKKWNSTVMLKSEKVLRTTTVTKENLVKKNKTKEKKSIVTKTQTKCLNCGHIYEQETIK